MDDAADPGNMFFDGTRWRRWDGHRWLDAATGLPDIGGVPPYVPAATRNVGAGPWERAEGRVAQRHGSRPRTLTTSAGDLELRIPSYGRERSSRRCWNGDAA